jgi:hypothetical protein
MKSDPILIAVGIIGTNELTDELLNDVMSKLPLVDPSLDELALLAIRRHLESSIGVSVSGGQGLTDGSILPWLDEIRPSVKWNYWDSYSKQLQSKGLGREVVRVLGEDSDAILNECGNPLSNNGWGVKGLVMGDVQSGKTASYSALISKAADVGYKIIVLLTGIIEDLRAQSQERLDEGFVGRDSSQLLDGQRSNAAIGAGRFRQNVPSVLTSKTSDFLTANKSALGGIPLKNLNEPVLLVMKKNKSPLSNLINFLKTQRENSKQLEMPMLLIDDEADNASVNASTDADPATINRLIRQLLQMFRRSSYVAYTATPFANVFINPDIDDELFPSNFVYCLETPSNYCGVADYFSGNGKLAKHVHHIRDAADLIPHRHKKTHQLIDIPQSLKDAVGTYLLCCALRDSRGENLRHRSMLVNASRFTDVQRSIATKIKDYLFELTEEIKQYVASDERWRNHAQLVALHELWVTHYEHSGVSWDTIRKCLHESIHSIKVVTINQTTEETERLNYKNFENSKYGRRVIAVGGLTLSRGLTLEGLCVSYFYRNSRAYDTLLQMGRWFGYRPGYEDLCRVWIEEDAQSWFSHIADVVAELRWDMRRMHANRRPPKEFGLRVRSHPGTLLVTAVNKMRNAKTVETFVSYSLTGLETAMVPSDVVTNSANIAAVKTLVESLSLPQKTKSRLHWTKVPKAKVAEFLERLHILDMNTGFMFDAQSKSRPLLSFIAQNDIAALSEWDICLPQGEGTSLSDFLVKTSGGGIVEIKPRQRQFERVPQGSKFLRFNKQRVGDAGDEKHGLTPAQVKQAEQDWKEQPKKSDEEIQKQIPGYFYRKYRKRPLLTLYVIEPTSGSKKDGKEPKSMPKEEIRPTHLFAIGLSFPEFDGTTNMVSYTLNKVALRAIGLVDDEEEEDYDDQD